MGLAVGCVFSSHSLGLSNEIETLDLWSASQRRWRRGARRRSPVSFLHFALSPHQIGLCLLLLCTTIAYDLPDETLPER